MTQSISQAIWWCGEPKVKHGRPILSVCVTSIARRRAPSPWQRCSNCGFSLVEVLVAVIVLAVGLLGMASLQVSVLKANDSAKFRTIATQASSDLADRIRADPGVILTPANATASLVLIDDTSDGACPSSDCDSVTSCLTRDFCALGLPKSKLVLDCSAAGGVANCGAGNCRITVSWDDKRGDARAADTTATTRRATFNTCARLPGS